LSLIEELESRNVPYEINDLSLDEIFEAQVIGRAQDWPRSEEVMCTA
jgi:hypothetical protein